MYRLGIWLIALSLVFNGAVTYAWMSPSYAQTAVAHNGHDGAQACNTTSDDYIAGVAILGQTQGAKHNHIKCCGTCTVASLSPSATSVPVTFSQKAAAFHTAQADLTGHLVALDPDIPKSIV